MPIHILSMYPNICYDEYSHPFVVVVVYYGVCTLGGTDTQDEEL